MAGPFKQGDQPPLCPNCGRPPWRADSVVQMDVNEASPEDAATCVCRHCSGIWILVDGAWAPVPDEMKADIYSFAVPVAVQFLLARLMGGIPKDRMN